MTVSVPPILPRSKAIRQARSCFLELSKADSILNAQS